jgi:hypothetical protein
MHKLILQALAIGALAFLVGAAAQWAAGAP